MIVDGQTGVLMPPKNAEALRDRLLLLLSDSELCRKLGENARKKAEAEFSMEQNIKQLLAVYQAIAEGREKLA